MLLAGDVGGTKTNLGIFFLDSSSALKLKDNTFKSFLNADYSSLESLIVQYISSINLKVENAVFAVAGPVAAGQVNITNLTWAINEEHLQKALNISRIKLINDLEATAYAVPFLTPDERYTINEGEPAAGGNIAVIAPGTGLGESFLAWNGSRYHAHATEGSHVDFAPTTELEVKLLNYLRPKFGHVSYERVCSGIGLPNIYSFLRDTGEAEESTWLSKQLSEAKDFATVIVNTALAQQDSCEICNMALDMFVSTLGAEAGNLALKVMAKGGVYVGGGIPPRILDILKNGLFMDAFKKKGRMSNIVSNIPVHVILDPKIAIIGAARYGFSALQ